MDRVTGAGAECDRTSHGLQMYCTYAMVGTYRIEVHSHLIVPISSFKHWNLRAVNSFDGLLLSERLLSEALPGMEPNKSAATVDPAA